MLRLPLLLTAAALGLWLWSVGWGSLPTRPGPTVHLLDRSRSVAEPPTHPVGGERYWFAETVGRDAEAVGRHASRLGHALTTIGAELPRDSRLVVHTDGAATDRLPPGWRPDVEVVWEPLPRIGLAFGRVDWPDTLATAGESLLRAVLFGADPESGRLALTSTPPGAVDLLDWGVGAGGALEARLRATGESARVELVWEGPQGRAVARRYATGSGPITEASLATGDAPLWVGNPRALTGSDAVARVEEHLAAGGLLLLTSALPADWSLPIPPWLRPLEVGDEGPAWEVLLDRSGSLAEEGMRAARDSLAAWAENASGAAIRVTPFAAELQAALDLAQPADRASLRALTPHGPTRLADAIEAWLPLLPAAGRLLILTDGQEGERPDADWADLGRRLRANGRELAVVAVGGSPALQRLALLRGQVPSGAEPDGATVAELLGEHAAAGGAVQPLSALWPLPNGSLPYSPPAKVRVCGGAVPLLRGEGGELLLALRPCREGAVLGLAAPYDANWRAALQPLFRALRGRPRVERTAGGTVLAHRLPNAERVAVLAPRRAAQPLTPVGDGSWLGTALPDDAPLSLLVDGVPAGLWPAPDREMLAQPEVWQDWLDRRIAARDRSVPLAWFLFAVAACAVLWLRPWERTRQTRESAREG